MDDFLIDDAYLYANEVGLNIDNFSIEQIELIMIITNILLIHLKVFLPFLVFQTLFLRLYHGI